MVTINREQAICMFYCEPYNESNVVKLSKLIDDMNNIEICYSDDPTEPNHSTLVPSNIINILLF
ncbi:hypothetical protein BC941DRAFT_441740 [Chlamydoabsidia padenii]|nr:hypothetical protein BC941DRAFT_441740 [Chlamydoabsidia padenii]